MDVSATNGGNSLNHHDLMDRTRANNRRNGAEQAKRQEVEPQRREKPEVRLPEPRTIDSPTLRRDHRDVLQPRDGRLNPGLEGHSPRRRDVPEPPRPNDRPIVKPSDNFGDFSANGNSEIDGTNENKGHKFVNHFDLNDDGKLSSREISQMSERQQQFLLNNFDNNKDGELSAREIKGFYKAMNKFDPPILPHPPISPEDVFLKP